MKDFKERSMEILLFSFRLLKRRIFQEISLLRRTWKMFLKIKSYLKIFIYPRRGSNLTVYILFFFLPKASFPEDYRTHSLWKLLCL